MGNANGGVMLRWQHVINAKTKMLCKHCKCDNRNDEHDGSHLFSYLQMDFPYKITNANRLLSLPLQKLACILIGFGSKSEYYS